MSVASAKSDPNALKVASILSIGSIILCFLTTLVNESYCEFVIGTLVGIMVGSSIGTIYSSAPKSNGHRKRVPKKPPDKNESARVRSKRFAQLIVTFGLAAIALVSSRLKIASQRRRWTSAKCSQKQMASLVDFYKDQASVSTNDWTLSKQNTRNAIANGATHDGVTMAQKDRDEFVQTALVSLWMLSRPCNFWFDDDSTSSNRSVTSSRGRIVDIL